VVIYGAGYYGLSELRNLKALGIQVDCFYDSDSRLSGKMLCGVPILGLDSLSSLDKSAAIIISSTLHSVQIENMLRGFGFINIFLSTLIFNDHTALLFYSQNSEEKHAIAEQSKEKIDFVYRNLADAQSRAVFNANIQLWLNGDFAEALRLRTLEGYYPEHIIKFGNDEVFVDCGAYTCDSSIEFVEKTNGKYRKIYAYESDELSFEMAKRSVAKMNVRRVEIRNIGVYSKKGVMEFTSDDNVGNRAKKGGGKIVPVDSLDNLLQGRPEPVTYIKIDIEGAEMEALRGAKRIITEDAPKLAISVYHKFGDIWEIPEYILTHFPGYSIFIRNDNVLCDDICFAVKEQRSAESD